MSEEILVSTKLFELLTAHMKENCPNCCVEKLINNLNLEVDLADPQREEVNKPLHIEINEDRL
jgi:hypothetical protein